MNDNEIESVSNDTNSASTPGEIFTAARNQQGLTVKQVADRLHLRLSSVHAIESDSVEQGVSLTFTKGYVRLYARLLGLNAQPLLTAFDTLHAQNTQPAKLQSFSRRVAREANDSRWNMVTYIIVLLVIGSVVVWWVDQSSFSFTDSFETPQQTPIEQVSEERQESPVMSQQLGDSGDDLETPSPNASSDGAIEELMQASEATVIESEQLADTGEQVDELNKDLNDEVNNPNDGASIAVRQPNEQLRNNAASDLPYTVNSDGSVNMVFTFSDDCWVSVKDAFDETIAVGVKVKGRVMEVSGIPPITVILGAPQNVAIDFGGQSVNMRKFDDGRSANFQLPMQGD